MQSEKTFILWPIPPFGAEENDQNQNGNNDGGAGNSNNQQQQQNLGQQQNSKKDDEKDDDEDDPYKGLSAKELKRLLSDSEGKRKTAETERDSAKDAQTKADRAKMDENDRLKAEKTDDANKIEELRAANAKLALIGAIRDDSRFEWHNPEIVAQQFKPDEVTVSDDGKVEGIAKALTRVAKENDYLLKAKADSKNNQQQQQNNQQQQNGGGNVTGFQPGQGGASNGGNVDPNVSALVEKMPALASRIR
jgi:hypothetical protein